MLLNNQKQNTMKTLNPYQQIIDSISDERENGDGIWVYLKKEWADFCFDPHHPTRQIHESTIGKLVERFKMGRVRKITDSDFYKFPHLRY